MEILHYKVIYHEGNSEVGYLLHVKPKEFATYEEAESFLFKVGYVRVGNTYFGTTRCIKSMLDNPKAKIDAVLSNGYFKSRWDVIEKQKHLL